MNKDTLGHYGWIVVVVIIIAILLGCSAAFATGVKVNFINMTNRLTNEMDEGFDAIGETEGGNVNLALTITAPESEDPATPTQVDSSTFVAYGTATATAGIQSLTVNNIPVTVEADRSWNAPLTLAQDAVTTVTVVLTDNNGDSITETRYIQYAVKPTPYALVLDYGTSTFAIDPGFEGNALLVFTTSNEPIAKGDVYTTDDFGDLAVLDVYTGFENETYGISDVGTITTPWFQYCNRVVGVIAEKEIMPTSMAYWFFNFTSCLYFDLAKINTSAVKDMSFAFIEAGSQTDAVTFIGLENWDTSSVTSMTAMFAYAGCYSETFSIDISGWDTSSVTSMQRMFYSTGCDATTWSIGNISGWNTSSLENVKEMFCDAGVNADYSLDLSGWNVTSVTEYDSFNANVSTKVIAPAKFSN